MGIYKSPSLREFLDSYRETGVDVSVYESKSKDANGNKHFVLRVFDPEDEDMTGKTFIASFSRSSLEEFSRVPSNGDAAVKKAVELHELLHDDKRCTRDYVACFCIIDDESVANGYADEKDLGKTFVTIAPPGTADSLVAKAFKTAKDENTVKEVASPTRSRGRRSA